MNARPNPASPAMVRRQLGAELRRLRTSRALKLEDVAAWVGVAPSTVSRIETGKAPARISYVRAMLDRFQVTDEDCLQELLTLASQGYRESWHAGHAGLLPAGAGDYLDLEIDASEIRAYAARSVPGFLQTAGYAAAARRASRPGLNGTDAAAWAGLQQRRQELLLAGRRQLRVIIEESALRGVIGSRGTMAGQLRHLTDVAVSAPVTIRVAPLAAARPVLSPPFTVLAFDSPSAATAVAWTSGLNAQVTVTTSPQDVAEATETFTALTRAALPPEESVRLIRHLAEQTPDTRA